jgi:hypothetical protein
MNYAVAPTVLTPTLLPDGPRLPSPPPVDLGPLAPGASFPGGGLEAELTFEIDSGPRGPEMG